MTITTEPLAPAVIELIGAQVGRAAHIWHAYKAHQSTALTGCPFCVAHSPGSSESIVERNATMLVVPNAFPYAVWDSALVEDHLMITSVRHLLSLDEFDEQETADFIALVRRYEAAGYSVYTRSQGNKGRSVGHLHTHLIKTGAFYAGV